MRHEHRLDDQSQPFCPSLHNPITQRLHHRIGRSPMKILIWIYPGGKLTRAKHSSFLPFSRAQECWSSFFGDNSDTFLTYVPASWECIPPYNGPIVWAWPARVLLWDDFAQGEALRFFLRNSLSDGLHPSLYYRFPIVLTLFSCRSRAKNRSFWCLCSLRFLHTGHCS